MHVRDLGASGDGVTLDTAAVQRAIDEAGRRGGVVSLGPGVYRCGTLHLRSHVTVRIEAGATLLASPDDRDFDPFERLAYVPWSDQETSDFGYALLRGHDVERVTISGRGLIADPRGHRGGPKPIAFKRSRDIVVRDVTIVDAPNYAVSMLGCDNVRVDGVTIRGGFSDGIDPDCSRRVHIANCDVDSWDDAICLKTSLALGERRPTEDVVVTNCTLRSSCNAIKIGTETSGDVRNVAVSNCTIAGRPGVPRPDENSGVAIESVDGAHVVGVVVANIVMRDVETPLFVRLGNRGRGMNPPRPGTVAEVSIANVVATGASRTSSITGLPVHPVRNIAIAGFRVTTIDTDPGTVAVDVPECEADYPRATMFGVLPARVLYARHVKGLSIERFSYGDVERDPRPAFVCDDVESTPRDR